MDIKILNPGDKVLVECTVQAVFANSKMVMVTTRDCTEGFDAYVDEIQEIKKGHWIPTYGNVKCSVCGSVKDSRDVGKATHYCDFCGAKMVEPQESEG